MKLFVRTCSGLTAALLCVSALADTPLQPFDPADPINGCPTASSGFEPGMQRVIYVNGIQNTRKDAQDTRDRIEAILETSYNHGGAAKKQFYVTFQWNPYGLDGTLTNHMIPTIRQDMKELFLQKTGEEMYKSDIESIRYLHNAPRTIDQAAAARIAGYAFAGMTPGRRQADLWTVTQSGTSNSTPQTAFPVSSLVFGDNRLQMGDSAFDAEVVANAELTPSQLAVNNLAAEVQCPDVGPAIVVAHSQGNIIATLAYSLLAANGFDVGKNMRVVNLANTLSFSVNNLVMTQANDTILSTVLHHLENYGMASWWRYTPSCGTSDASNRASYLCTFDMDPPTLEAPPETISQETVDGTIQVPNNDCSTNQFLPSGISWSEVADWAIFNITPSMICEHGVLDMYLSERITTVSDSRSVVYTKPTQRFRDFFEDLVYQASKSLDDANTPTYTEVYHTDFWVNGQGITGYDTTEGGPHWTFNSAMFNPNQYNEGWWEFKPTSTGVTGRMTISLPNIQVARGSGYGNVRISWRQYVAGSKEYRMVAGARNSSGANFALVATSPGSNYACKGAYGIATDSTSTCYGHWSSLMNRWVDVVAVVGVNKLELTVDGVTYTDTSPRLPIIDSFEFHVAGNAIMYIDYLKIDVQNP
jgi:hypothetical protein